MKIINENEEIELAAFPECYNRLNVTYKKDSKTTPARMVNDHSTLHHPGMSCNIAQVKGKTSLNLCHNVLFHFFLHAVPLVMDLAKCYRSVRCKTLTNSIRRVIWFTNPWDERTATTMMMLRMAYGDKIADKVISLICRHHLAPEAEKEENGSIGKRVGKLLRNEMYLDDGNSSFKTKTEKDESVKLLKTIFNKYSLKGKHYISSEEFTDEEDFKQLETTNENYIETILGLRFNYKDDTLLPSLVLNPSKKVRNIHTGPDLDKINVHEISITKRKFCRLVAQQYDSTGRFLSPSIIRGKILYSQICRYGLEWDDQLPPELEKEAKKYLKELQKLMTDLKPWHRPLLQLNAKLIKIIATRDGSATGLGTLIYFISKLPNGQKISRVAAGKTRVSNLTMNAAEATAIPLSLNVIANMVAELQDLQEIENLLIISAGDSESVSYSYNPERAEKNVLIRNSSRESIRAANRILSFNPNATILLSWIEGQKNSADLVSKPHVNLFI